MARPFVFAALCQRAHPPKHSLAESEKQRKKSSLAGSLVSRSITVLAQWQSSTSRRNEIIHGLTCIFINVFQII
jgi:hypothetical protein